MVKRIVLDLDMCYAKQKREFLRKLEKKFVLEPGNAAVLTPEDTVVLTDKECFSRQWEDYAVIGIEHGVSINSVPFILENLEDLTDYDIQLAYARKFGIPCVIAKNERFMLREAAADDIAELMHIYGNAETVKYIPALDDEESERNKLLSYIRYMYGYYGYGLWVMQDNVTGALIGRAGIEHRELDGECCYELAYLVREEYQRMGYGYQAARMVLDFAQKYGIKQIITYIHEKNIPSVRLSEKLGFTEWKEITDGMDKYIISRKEL